MPMETLANEMIVYRARNIVNGREYIGVTGWGLKSRKQNHFCQARTGKGFALHAAIRKYGEDKFVFDPIAVFEDRDLALVYEQEMIAKWRPAYNISLGGEGRTGPMSEEHKRNISIANKGQGLGRKGPPLSDAHKQRLREVNLGNQHMLGWRMSEEAKEKISVAHTGRVHLIRRGVPRSAETVAKISAANKGRPSIWKGTKRDYGAKISAALTGKPWTPTAARLAALSKSVLRARAAREIPVICLADGAMFQNAVHAATAYGVSPKLIRQSIKRGHALRSGLRFAHGIKA